MNPGDFLRSLKQSAAPLAEVEIPNAPGVYAFYLAPGAELPGITQSREGPLYLGISGNLAQRDFDTHFAAGQSGFSTLRRSIGALLRTRLDLGPRPRGTGASDTNYRNYRFDEAGEHALAGWMTTNLLIGAKRIESPQKVEKELIALACSPLNLTHWANPDGSAIKAARKACVEAARAGRR